jgi:hypothetical protein
MRQCCVCVSDRVVSWQCRVCDNGVCDRVGRDTVCAELYVSMLCYRVAWQRSGQEEEIRRWDAEQQNNHPSQWCGEKQYMNIKALRRPLRKRMITSWEVTNVKRTVKHSLTKNRFSHKMMDSTFVWFNLKSYSLTIWAQPEQVSQTQHRYLQLPEHPHVFRWANAFRRDGSLTPLVGIKDFSSVPLRSWWPQHVGLKDSSCLILDLAYQTDVKGLTSKA